MLAPSTPSPRSESRSQLRSLSRPGARPAGALRHARTGDRARVVAAVVLTLVSIPWITAAVGVHFPQGLFLTSELYAEPGEEARAAVHLGQHHSTGGFLLALTALLLSRPRLVTHRLRTIYAALACLMLAYGVANVVNDFWHEQFVKRGWVSWDIPESTTPDLKRDLGARDRRIRRAVRVRVRAAASRCPER